MVIMWIKTWSAQGFPPTWNLITESVDMILQERYGDDTLHVSDWWISQFIDANYLDLSTKWARSHDKSCADALNPTNVKDYFEKLAMALQNYQVIMKNIYGFDEMGIMSQTTRNMKVVTARASKHAKVIADAHRESMSLLVLVCADGKVFKPTAIFKGNGINTNWVNINPLKCTYVYRFEDSFLFADSQWP